MVRFRQLTAVAAVVILTAMLALPDAEAAQASAVAPTVVPGHGSLTCADLGFPGDLKIDPPSSGTFSAIGYGTVTVAVDSGLLYLSWSSTFGIDAVIAKGGSEGTNVYVYTPESYGDTQLSVPQAQCQLSYVSFCFDAETPTPTSIPPTETATPADPTPTATEPPPTATITVVLTPNSETETPAPSATPPAGTNTPALTTVPQDEPTVTANPTNAPASTPEPAQTVLPSVGETGAPGSHLPAGPVVVALLSVAYLWVRARVKVH
jgi:hypothetical protein